MDYVFVITYNFDNDYIIRKCNSDKKAVELLQKYLQDEIETIVSECGYQPSVLAWDETDVTLVYAEGYTTDDMNRNHALEDCAYYRVFKI